jgi:rifampicin phosphotransferase
VKVIPLEALPESGEARFGAKAVSLARLSRIGLPVPSGFCVAGAAYREHVELNNLRPRIKEILDRLATAAKQEKQALLSELRANLQSAPLSESLCREIEENYRRLAAAGVAVRSSATAEDLPGHSFAGQYDTCLGVTDLPACLAAIPKCWASLWTERAWDYREQNRFDHLSADMAVIVQALVPADAAGVIFTADPVTGDRNRIVIEAVFGLGEGLVSGKVTPDRLVFSKPDLRLLEHIVAAKTIQLTSDGNGRVSEQVLSPDRAHAPCLQPEVARRLAELALSAEAAMQKPQDVEWAVREGKIFFLQSRPITTLKPRPSWEDRQVWSNVNTAEVLPDVVTPLTWSVIRKVEVMIASIFGQLGVHVGSAPLVGRVGGRAYFNLNTTIGAMRSLPGIKKVNLSELMGGAQGKMADLGHLQIPEEDIPQFQSSRWRLLLLGPGVLWYVFRHRHSRAAVYLQGLRARAESLTRVEVSRLSEDELLTRLENLIDELMVTDGPLAWQVPAMGAFAVLDQLCRKWFPDSGAGLTNRLVTGQGGMDSAEAGVELWRLAAAARELGEVEAILSAGETFALTRAKLSRVEAGKIFLERWDQFLAQHGHHTQGEIELGNPRWSERPNYVLEMVRSYLKNFDRANPVANLELRAKQREDQTRQCQQRLNFFKRRAFDYFLRGAQFGSLTRENIKSASVRCLGGVRSLALELGRRLTEKQILDRPEDVFFLDLDELDPVRHGAAPFAVKKTIAERRAEYQLNLTLTPPPVVIGKFDPRQAVPAIVDVNAEILTGLGVSAGVATGPARVILRADSGETVLPGEILVAPFTDPGWTPYFITAAGIVMDQGGMLSHGSIVAREYGIPAVVNVGPATRIIKTGQTLQVDGNRGVVKILSAF